MITSPMMVTIHLQPFQPYVNLALKNSYRTGIWLSTLKYQYRTYYPSWTLSTLVLLLICITSWRDMRSNCIFPEPSTQMSWRLRTFHIPPFHLYHRVFFFLHDGSLLFPLFADSEILIIHIPNAFFRIFIEMQCSHVCYL